MGLQNVKLQIVKCCNALGIHNLFKHQDKGQGTGPSAESDFCDRYMQHGVGYYINSDTECTGGLPDMDDKGSIDVPCAETWEMGSWNLSFEVTVPIIMYVASVANTGCNVYANTLRMLNLVVGTLPSPSVYFSSDILTTSLIPDDLVTAFISFKYGK